MKYPINSCIGTGIKIEQSNVAQKRFMFQDVVLLRNKKISYVTISDTPEAITALQGVSDTVLRQTYLVLVSAGKEVVNRISLDLLRKMKTQDMLFYIGSTIEIEKSYVETTATLTADTSFAFLFFIGENPKLKKIVPNEVQNQEVYIKDGTLRRYYFPDNIKLRGKKVLNIITSGDSVTKTPNNYDVLSVDDQSKGSLTLVDGNGKKIVDRLPLIDLFDRQGVLTMIYFSGIVIDWANSFIDFTSDVENERALFINLILER